MHEMANLRINSTQSRQQHPQQRSPVCPHARITTFNRIHWASTARVNDNSIVCVEGWESRYFEQGVGPGLDDNGAFEGDRSDENDGHSSQGTDGQYQDDESTDSNHDDTGSAI